MRYSISRKVKTSTTLKIRAVLIDDSILHIREFVSSDDISYSYNWIDKNGSLICRWDNAPHYKNIKTFPHHKHTKKGIEESFETTLEDVLSVIEKKIK